MKPFPIFMICLMIFSPLAAQKLTDSLPLRSASLLNIDESGYIYVVTEKRNIIKYSPELEQLMEFRATKNGEIKILDVNNPMEIVFYQPGFNRMTILDRLMSQKFELDFNQYNQMKVSSIAQSLDGQYWLYDALNAQLVKINKQYLETTRSNDLRLSQVSNFEPDKLEETTAGVLAFEKGHGFVLFDRYANVLLADWEDKELIGIHLVNNHWLKIYQDRIVVTDYHQGGIVEDLSREQIIIDARIHGDRLIVLDHNGLYIYSFDQKKHRDEPSLK